MIHIFIRHLKNISILNTSRNPEERPFIVWNPLITSKSRLRIRGPNSQVYHDNRPNQLLTSRSRTIWNIPGQLTGRVEPWGVTIVSPADPGDDLNKGFCPNYLRMRNYFHQEI